MARAPSVEAPSRGASMSDPYAGLHAVYQPIVELATGQTVGFESLLRDEDGVFPLELFESARRLGAIGEIDWAARLAAVRGALDAGLPADIQLFVNVEPETLGDARPASADAGWERAACGLSVVLEITERAVTAHPAELLRSIAAARARGWGIAIDDVGADSRSLALMPVLRPDVIKLDLRLVQLRPTREIARIVHAVRAESERTGAAILAEGIETAQHLEAARAFGATLGQGYLFGRPDELPDSISTATRPAFRRASVAAASPRTPFALIGSRLPSIRARKPLLIEMSKQLEEEAAALGASCIVLSAFQTREFFTPATAIRYERLGQRTGFVAALGQEMPRTPVPGVVGRDLALDDPLCGEWTVAVVAPHFAACLSAVDRGDSGPQMRKTFDYVLTFDRDLVLGAATALLGRV